MSGYAIHLSKQELLNHMLQVGGKAVVHLHRPEQVIEASFDIELTDTQARCWVELGGHTGQLTLRRADRANHLHLRDFIQDIANGRVDTAEPAPPVATQLAPCPICGGEAIGYDYARPLSTEFIHCVTCRYKYCQKTEGHASQDAATKAWNALQSLAETAPAEATAEPASQSLRAEDESTLRYICRHGGTRQLSDTALVTVHLAGTYHALLSAGGTTEHLTAATDGLLYAVLGGRLDQLLAA